MLSLLALAYKIACGLGVLIFEGMLLSALSDPIPGVFIKNLYALLLLCYKIGVCVVFDQALDPKAEQDRIDFDFSKEVPFGHGPCPLLF